jgi:hypothetical protein
VIVLVGVGERITGRWKREKECERVKNTEALHLCLTKI